MKLNNRGNWSLLGLLVAVAIVVIAAAYLYGGRGGVVTVDSNSKLLDKASKKQTTLGKAMDTAKAADCRQRLIQIRSAIQMYRDQSTDATPENPKSFKDMGLGVSTDFYQCPMSGQLYTYDPATGTVKCPTHPTF
jgi:flagellin-like protein